PYKIKIGPESTLNANKRGTGSRIDIKIANGKAKWSQCGRIPYGCLQIETAIGEYLKGGYFKSTGEEIQIYFQIGLPRYTIHCTAPHPSETQRSPSGIEIGDR